MTNNFNSHLLRLTCFSCRPVLLILFYFVLGNHAQAQTSGCNLGNNTIQLKQAICTNSNGLMEGSTPTGGNGVYTYVWQVNKTDCGDNGFVDIPGATEADYSLPSTTDNKMCFRRIVKSNGCTDISNKVKGSATISTPAAPKATVTQPTCSVSTGTITVTSPAPGDGTTYSINGTTYTNTTGIFTGLAPKNYTVTAKYKVGCISPQLTVTVNAQPATPAAPTATVTISPTCLISTATIVISAPVGATYSLDGGNYQASPIFIGVSVGTHTLTAKIASSGCVSSPTTITVAAPAAPSAAITPATANICTGSSQVLTTSGGTSYQWYRNGTAIGGAKSTSYTATQSGTYTADIIVGSCTGQTSNSAVITVVPTPSGNITPATAAICTGGSATLTATGGTSYQWYKDGTAINGATTATYNATQAGVYTADIINGSCKGKATNSATVTVNPVPSGSIAPASANICTGGSVTLTTSGGLTYQWYKDGALIVNAINATYIATQSGTYSVDISNGSCKAKASNQTVVTVLSTPTGFISPAAITICTGSSTALTVSGGTSYQWYKDGVVINGATAASYTATAAGTYTADIFNGSCKGSASNSSIVSVAPVPTGTVSPTSGVLCTGGSLVLTATGGTSYQWYKDGTAIAGATAASYTATQAGTYTADVISGSCKGKTSNSAVITVGTTPTGAITPAAATICTGSSATLTVSGGSSYQWYKDGSIITGATSATYTATAAGSYTADIISGTCKGKSSNTAIVTTAVTPTGTISPAAVAICAGTSTVLSVTAGGASYQWYKDGAAISGATTNTYTATQAGTYTVDIFNGACKGTATNKAVVTVNAIPSGTITPATATICSGGSVLLSATGGSSYQWFKNGTAIAGATTASYTATTAGTYTVDIISNGCKASATNSSVVSVGAAPTGSIAPATGVLCGGSSLAFTVSGGTAYQWYKDGTIISGATSASYTATQAGTYTADIFSGSCKGQASNSAVITAAAVPTGTITPSTVTICAGNSTKLSVSPNGSSYQWYKDGVAINGAVADTYTASAAGTYSVDILNGSCKGTATNKAVVTVSSIPTGNITPATATICPGGAVALTATGGTSYQWYKDGIVISGANTATISATQGGVYTADISNSNGCKGKADNDATVTVGASPTGLIVPASISLCPGGSATATVSGGSSYQWYKDGVAIQNATQSTYTVSAAGTYTADIISGTCKGKSSNSLVVTIGTAPSGSIVPATAAICTGGSATLTVNGGSSYQWYKNGTVITGATAATYIATTTGSYTAIIFSGTCSGPASNTATVTQAAAPSGTISPANAIVCAGGSQVLTATGGTSYQWSRNGTAITGATDATYTASQSGTYSVVIKNGTCTGAASNTATVTINAAVTFSATTINPSCVIPAGTITINNVNGGTGNGYSFSKDNGVSFQSDNTFKDLAVGDYQVVVKDAAGCRSTPVAVSIKQINSTLQASATTSDATCAQSTGAATVTATGGTGPYTYSINGGSFGTSNVFNNLQAGAYKVLVKDAIGCSYEVNFTITQIASTLSTTAATTNPGCGQTTGTAIIMPAGGTPGYQFSLDGGSYQSANTFSNVSIGTHKVTVKDKIGCTAEVSFEIKQSPGATPNLVITNPPSLCAASTVNLREPSVTAGSDAGLAYSYWTDAAATAAVANPEVVSAAGTYYIKGANQTGCFVIKPVVVSIYNISAGDISPAASVSKCTGDSVVLTASTGVSYQWYRNDTLITGATLRSYKAIKTGIYSVFINNGTCTGRASNTVNLQFQDCAPIATPAIYVPTAFTPNKNGANDILKPIAFSIQELRYFKVYNRWGQQVFETNILGKGWDGTIKGTQQPAEVYSWILECTDIYGKVIKQSGRTLLIR